MSAVSAAEAPVLLNGLPLDRDAFDPDPEPTCWCRRCLLHDDPGGCLEAEQA